MGSFGIGVKGPWIHSRDVSHIAKASTEKQQRPSVCRVCAQTRVWCLLLLIVELPTHALVFRVQVFCLSLSPPNCLQHTTLSRTHTREKPRSRLAPVLAEHRHCGDSATCVDVSCRSESESEGWAGDWGPLRPTVPDQQNDLSAILDVGLPAMPCLHFKVGAASAPDPETVSAPPLISSRNAGASQNLSAAAAPHFSSPSEDAAS